MSRSLKRVTAALEAAGLPGRPVEMSAETRTAEQAAAAVGCALDQIAKSMVFQEAVGDGIVLFLTAGGNRVDTDKAAAAAGTPLARADAEVVRRVTGFAIGGVAPVGHLTPVRCFCDARLTAFDTVWAAAGTPRHVFPIAPDDLVRIARARIADFTG